MGPCMPVYLLSLPFGTTTSLVSKPSIRRVSSTMVKHLNVQPSILLSTFGSLIASWPLTSNTSGMEYKSYTLPRISQYCGCNWRSKSQRISMLVLKPSRTCFITGGGVWPFAFCCGNSRRTNRIPIAIIIAQKKGVAGQCTVTCGGVRTSDSQHGCIASPHAKKESGQTL